VWALYLPIYPSIASKRKGGNVYKKKVEKRDPITRDLQDWGIVEKVNGKG